MRRRGASYAGEILVTQNPTNSGAAEESFLTAIGIAQVQLARSFELRAALALARLYQSIGRPADADAVLRPALKGFVPTPLFPEIADALGLSATSRPTRNSHASCDLECLLNVINSSPPGKLNRGRSWRSLPFAVRHGLGEVPTHSLSAKVDALSCA